MLCSLTVVIVPAFLSGRKVLCNGSENYLLMD